MTSLSSESETSTPQSDLSLLLKERMALAAEIERRQRTNRLRFYRPYAKQHEFHSCQKRERLFMAGNQLGKTFAGAAEAAMHLTGRYDLYKGPNGEPWGGWRFDKPITMLAGSESYELTRDGVQRLMVGPPSHKLRHHDGTPRTATRFYIRNARTCSQTCNGHL